MLPTVTKVLNQENGLQKVQQNIIQAGRIQFILLGAALIGFAVVGKDFISLWLGDGYSDVYIITLILMIPSLLELCVNVCLSVLRAKNMLGFRTFVITGITILNAIITIIGVRYYGYLAAAIGTAISFVVGSLVIMNIYYYKKLSFPMLHFYREIFRGTWICQIIAGCVTYLASRYWFTDGWFGLIANVSIFIVIYFGLLLCIGLTKQEKRMIPVLNKFWK
jgi:O-antigen/teichoic acid export membrane protein